MNHAKTIVASQVNAVIVCRGIGFDPVQGLLEAVEYARDQRQPVSYHYVDNNTADGAGVERKVEIDAEGNGASGTRLSPAQLEHLYKWGHLHGAPAGEESKL